MNTETHIRLEELNRQFDEWQESVEALCKRLRLDIQFSTEELDELSESLNELDSAYSSKLETDFSQE